MGEDTGFGSTTIQDASVRHYEIVRRLNSGGMATVYLGRLVGARGFSRVVALKSMHPHYAADPNFSAMFVDEARLTALLHHPNIVPTLDVVAREDSLLLVMEYIDGSSLHGLQERVAANRTAMPQAIGCAIVHDLLAGLHHAHQAKDEAQRPLGIIHRDVSPQNVMVGRDGLARVLDFGIAKANGAIHATETGAIRGKVPYMAPEQLLGRELDCRADIYAAGVVLWEVLTGCRLFQGEGMALVSRILQEPVPAPSTVAPNVGPELDAVVMRALARNPADRFQTAAEMARALAAAVTLAGRAALASWVAEGNTLPSAERVAVAPRTQTSLVAFTHADEPSARMSSRFASKQPFAIAAIMALVTTLGVMAGARGTISFGSDAHASTSTSKAAAWPAPPPEDKPTQPAPVQVAPAAPAVAPAPAAADAGVEPAAPARAPAARAKGAPAKSARPAARPRFEADLGF